MTRASAYLASCSYVPRNADVYGEPRFKRACSRRLALFVEIIISFEIEYTRETSFGCFMYEQYL